MKAKDAKQGHPSSGGFWSCFRARRWHSLFTSQVVLIWTVFALTLSSLLAIRPYTSETSNSLVLRQLPSIGEWNWSSPDVMMSANASENWSDKL